MIRWEFGGYLLASSAYMSENVEQSSIRKINPMNNEGGNSGKKISNTMNIDRFSYSNNNISQQRRDSDAWNQNYSRRESPSWNNNNSSQQQRSPNNNNAYNRSQQERAENIRQSSSPPNIYE